jgi:hypothetical protein
MLSLMEGVNFEAVAARAGLFPRRVHEGFLLSSMAIETVDAHRRVEAPVPARQDLLTDFQAGGVDRGGMRLAGASPRPIQNPGVRPGGLVTQALGEKRGIQRPIVVIVVAAGVPARGGFEISVVGPLRDDVVMAREAELAADRDPLIRHGVFRVAGAAVQGIDRFESGGPPGIVKDLQGVSVFLKLRSVARDAPFVGNGRESHMARIAGGFENVVAVRSLSWQKDAPRIEKESEAEQNDSPSRDQLDPGSEPHSRVRWAAERTWAPVE